MYNKFKSLIPILLIFGFTIVITYYSSEWMTYNLYRINDKPEILIMPDFYDKNDFEKIENIVYEKNKHLKYDTRMIERKTYLFKKQSNKYNDLYDLLYNDKFISTTEKYINSNNKRDIRKLQINSFPIEYRKYDKNSAGMEWHKDLAIFNGDSYYECVLTITNNSESYFEYINREGFKERIYTKPNMLICVMPNIVPHYVSPTNNGEREILKFIATYDNNTPNENYFKEIKGEKYF